MSELEPPYPLIAGGLLRGTVVPFFGAAASAVYRPDKAPSWDLGAKFLPFGSELAKVLARESAYGETDKAYKAALSGLADAAANAVPNVQNDIKAKLRDDIKAKLEPVLSDYLGGPPGLALIASFFLEQADRVILYSTLRDAFQVKTEPGALHKALAAIDCIKLYVTTNYDDLLEQALEARDPHVLVDKINGLALRNSDGTLEPIDRMGKDLAKRLATPHSGEQTKPILFKMHGSIDRKGSDESYLITEEDYVDYLGRDSGNYIPVYIDNMMRGKNLLFLGYSLEDWNVRVILSKLLAAPKRATPPVKSSEGVPRYWAIVKGRSDTEQMLWKRQSLNIYPVELLEFSERLVAELDRLRR
jgi:hypothetical protein